jgi:hypothetical protein
MASRDPSQAIKTWGSGSSAPRDMRMAERPLEKRVSDYLGAMTLLVLNVPDISGPESSRRIVERNSIALLSNFEKPALDAPSPDWLGHFSSRDRVQRSGLWNNSHVEEPYDPGFLDLFEDLITGRSVRLATRHPAF